MAKLHEVLAVDRDLEQQAKKITEEAIKAFSDKANLFIGSHRSLEMFDEGRKQEEAAAVQHQAITTTVPKKLEYVKSFLVSHLDAVAQKETTNQHAKADIVISGSTILKDVPATLLLSLESKLVAWRNIYNAIPTLQPGHEWVEETSLGAGVFKTALPKITNKTEKHVDHKIIVPATKEHPAQVHEYSVEKPVGKYTEQVYSGMITPAKKAEMISRIEKLIAATKKARARANQQEVVKTNIGKILWEFINA